MEVNFFDEDERFKTNPLSNIEYWVGQLDEKPETLELLASRWWKEASAVFRSCEIFDEEEGDLSSDAFIVAEADVLYWIANIIGRKALKLSSPVDCGPLFSFWMACRDDRDNERQVEIALLERCRAVAAIRIIRLAMDLKLDDKAGNMELFESQPKIGERVAALYDENPEAMEWTAAQIAEMLRCEASSVRKTKAWRMKQRQKEQSKDEARQRYNGITNPEDLY